VLTNSIALLLYVNALLAADPFVGTWRLEPSKSSGTIPKDETVIIQKHGRMFTVEVQVLVADSSSLVIKYKVPVSGGKGQLLEKGPYDGVSVKRMNASTLEIAYLSSGKSARSTGAVVSEDGKTMTSIGNGSNESAVWTIVFRKQLR
jgi:hypothetical protein